MTAKASKERPDPDDELSVALGTKITPSMFQRLQVRWKGKQSKGEWLRNVLIFIDQYGDMFDLMERRTQILLEEMKATAYVQEVLLHHYVNGTKITADGTKEVMAASQRRKRAMANDALKDGR